MKLIQDAIINSILFRTLDILPERHSVGLYQYVFLCQTQQVSAESQMVELVSEISRKRQFQKAVPAELSVGRPVKMNLRNGLVRQSFFY